MQVLPVVVVPPVDGHVPNPKELLQLHEARGAFRALHHHEAVRHLIPGRVALSVPPAWLPDESDREASFSVYKTDNPAKLDQPFLLVFRTGRIVTAHRTSLWRVPAGYTG